MNRWLRGSLLLVLALGNAGCNEPEFLFGAVIGGSSDLTTHIRSDAYIVFVCPGERVTIGWLCTKDCDKMTVSPEPQGQQNPQSGQYSFAATTTQDYVATSSNKNGTTTHKVTVNVITGAYTMSFTAALKKAPTLLWDADLPSWAYTPLAKANQDQFTKGFPIPSSAKPWSLVTPSGNSATIDDTPRPMAASSLPGLWRIGNDGLTGREDLPATLSVTLGLLCQPM
jgi:hypothetical protein